MNVRTVAALFAAALLAACAATEPAATPATGVSPTATASGRSVAPGSEEDLVANVGDRVFFDYNKADLKDAARATLDKQAAWLTRFPQDHVLIAGNTDERGTEEYNFVLGQRRANTARDYLVAKGVAAGRIATISYGKDRPTALGSNEEAWAQNRNAITSVQ